MRLDVDPKDTGSIPVMLVVEKWVFSVCGQHVSFCREELVRVQQNSLKYKLKDI